MPQFLIKAGTALLLAAGIIIVISFIGFALFALLLLAPGLMLYKAGLQSFYNSHTHDNAKIIDVTPEVAGGNFTNKGKTLLKTGARKMRNFLNKYAD